MRSRLAIRLIAGFVAVAVAAVFVLAGLTLWRTKHTVGQLAAERQQSTADVIAASLAVSYQNGDGWAADDTHSAVMLAVQANGALTVLDAGGAVVQLHGPMGNLYQSEAISDGDERRAAVIVDGRQVGTAVVTFTSGELAQAEQHVRDALRGAVLIGALLAAIVALGVAIPLARRVIRPLSQVTDAARRLGEGEVTARVGGHDAPGELGRLAATFDDMADRLQAHETARRNLTADVAHELRTPLTVLQGSCEEIIDGIAEPSLERFVQLHDDVLRLRHVVDDLGVLADADAATTEPLLRHERCDLATIAAAVADSMASTIDANQHQLVRRLETVMVDGDRVRLEQVVTNLLTNAIKFTPPGGHLELHVGPSIDGRGAVLTVIDDGPGVSRADRAHVFERFYRSESSRPIAGSGIGLAVVDQLARAHGGRVAIAESDHGAEVVVTLPVHDVRPAGTPVR